MIGLILQYKPRQGNALVKLNYEIFGRIIKTISAGEKVYYYQKGLLHNVQYKKLINGKYFIRDIKLKEDIKRICDKYCNSYKLFEDVRIFKEEELTTGLKCRMEMASEKNYKVRKWV